MRCVIILIKKLHYKCSQRADENASAPLTGSWEVIAGQRGLILGGKGGEEGRDAKESLIFDEGAEERRRRNERERMPGRKIKPRRRRG